MLHRVAAVSSRRLHSGILLAAILLGIAAVGCTPVGRGTYQVDIFSEMHYTQAYRSQEPPRLYPPLGSVPFAPVGMASLVIGDPVSPDKTASTVAMGEYLFGVNCVVCHGAQGKGNGAMVPFLVKSGGILPPDITSSATAGQPDERLFGMISEGGTTKLTFAQAGLEPDPSVDKLITMPVFRKLLTEEERWMLVHYVRELQGQ